jgi:hypothetical protein
LCSDATSKKAEIEVADDDGGDERVDRMEGTSVLGTPGMRGRRAFLGGGAELSEEEAGFLRGGIAAAGAEERRQLLEGAEGRQRRQQQSMSYDLWRLS